MDLRGESYVDHMVFNGLRNILRFSDLRVQSITHSPLCQPLSDTLRTSTTPLDSITNACYIVRVKEIDKTLTLDSPGDDYKSTTM